jgi:large subunit ribosomal protein L22
MQVSAKLKNLRTSPRKVRLVANFIKGLDVSEALNQLEAQVKKSNPVIKKLLDSAISNAENNFGLDKDNLYVYSAKVEAGATLKRWMPRAFGRASTILKRTSQIEIILEERVEGKGRKTKEEMEKEKQKRLDTKKKQEKEAKKEQTEKEEVLKNEGEATVKNTEKIKESGKIKKGGETKGGLASRIFRRKSM